MSESEPQSAAFLMKNKKYIKISVSDSGMVFRRKRLQRYLNRSLLPKGWEKVRDLGFQR